MFNFFNKYTLPAYAMLPIVLILFRIPMLMSPSASLTAYDSDLYTPLWKTLFGNITEGGTLSKIFALLIDLVTLFMVNLLTNTFKFTDKQSHLGGFFFIILSSGFIVSQGFHPICIFTLMFVMALYRLFRGTKTENHPKYCFDAGLLFSIGSLLWAKGLWMFAFHIIMLVMLRMLTLRSLLATLHGIAIPIIITATYFFMTDSITEATFNYIQNVIVPVAFYKTGILAKIYLGALTVILLASIIHVFKKMQTQKIVESRYSKIMIWTILYCVAALMLPHYSFEVQQLIAVCGAIIIASYLQSIRSKIVAEIMTLLMVVLVWSLQWLS